MEKAKETIHEMFVYRGWKIYRTTDRVGCLEDQSVSYAAQRGKLSFAFKFEHCMYPSEFADEDKLDELFLKFLDEKIAEHLSLVKKQKELEPNSKNEHFESLFQEYIPIVNNIKSKDNE